MTGNAEEELRCSVEGIEAIGSSSPDVAFNACLSNLSQYYLRMHFITSCISTAGIILYFL